MSKIDQKEYLKKYLSGEKEKKRRKKNSYAEKNRVKIIDDDIDVIRNRLDDDDDLILTGEDAPMIVGVIDDRPPELKTIEDFRSSEKWKSVSTNDNISEKNNAINVIFSNKQTKHKANFSSKNEREGNVIIKERNKISKYQHLSKNSNDDLSPKRKDRRTSEDYSPPRKQNIISKRKKSFDISPNRVQKVLEENLYSKRSGEDFSPPRRQEKIQLSVKSKHTSKSSESYSDDYSPPRRKDGKKLLDENLSSKRSGSEDFSPPRRQDKCVKSKRTSNNRDRRHSDDYSPPRRKDGQHNSEKYNRSLKIQGDHLSIRKKSPCSGSDYSPRRQRGYREKKNSVDLSSSPLNKNQSHLLKMKEKKQTSPGRVRTDNNNKFQSSLEINEFGGKDRGGHERTSKTEQTLGGKKAGLQNAESLKRETQVLRKKENEMFSKMSTETTGRNAEIVVRDKRLRTSAEIQKEKEKEKEKSETEREKQEAYARWGAGLKQIENYQSKIADEMHEISKPLARYSNDADLDELLKKQERDGDPMLAYIRQKNQEINKNNNVPTIPIYKGACPENRFNIRPGYRWDGVDRSNGYENKWFDMQNQKKAIQEEAYKYSIEDM